MNILEADSIQLSFSERRILSDVYLRCETGKVTGLLGRNGEGKSCLMKILMGSLAAKEGIIRINGEFIKPMDRKKYIRYMPQFNFTPPGLKVRSVLEHFEQDCMEFESCFPEFSGRMNSTLITLAGGMRRMLELYVILKSPGMFIFLDEPFTHLYPIQVEKVLELISSEKENKAILISDHMFRHVIKIADPLYLLRQGKLHKLKSLEEIETLGYALL